MADLQQSLAVEVKPNAELTALVDRLEKLAEQFQGCTVRVLELQPGDVIVFESAHPVSELMCETLLRHARLIWPNNKAAVIDRGVRVAGVTRETKVDG